MKRMDCCSGVSKHRDWCRMRIIAVEGAYMTTLDMSFQADDEEPCGICKGMKRVYQIMCTPCWDKGRGRENK